MEFQTSVCIAINFYGNIVDSFVSGGNGGHSGFSMGCVYGCVALTQNVIYFHTKNNKNKAHFDGKCTYFSL